MIYAIIGPVVILIAAVLLYVNKSEKKINKWVNTEEFQEWKKRLTLYSKEDEFEAFVTFLEGYGGGYVKRKSGRIIAHEYLNREKGDLKGIFFNLVFPNPNIPVSRKEEFRRYLISIGVDGLDKRPEYETRDTKLKNNKVDKDDFERKEVGNKGEALVRDVLAGLDSKDYAVINGPVLRVDGITKEFDHIVVGKNGVFCIETKAFGMSEGKAGKALLTIEDGDKWVTSRGKYRKELESPTVQMNEEKAMFDGIAEEFMIDVRAVLVLSNTEITVKNQGKLPYDVVRADELKDYILGNKDVVLENDRMFVVKKIDDVRVN